MRLAVTFRISILQFKNIDSVRFSIRVWTYPSWMWYVFRRIHS